MSEQVLVSDYIASFLAERGRAGRLRDVGRHDRAPARLALPARARRAS